VSHTFRIATLLVLPLLAGSAYAQLLSPSQQTSRLLPYTTCNFSGGLASTSVDRAPNLPMARSVETTSGPKRVSVADGYRLMLAYPNTDPFVNLKVEVSVPGQYASDKRAVIEQMETMAAGARGVSMKVERSTTNGVEVAALNNPTLEASGLSFYSLFDDRREMIVTAYILNQRPERRAFQDMASYKKLKDAFVAEYVQCMAKNRAP